MRNFLISIIGIFMVFSAQGTGENVATSKSYVDSAIAEKQNIIGRTNGNPQALTNTGTSGEYGTKEFYDSTGSYAEQSDALIDAVTMNTAVQNAIDSEFVCVEWVDPNDNTSDCLLFKINGINAGIQPGDGEWFRAYLNYETPTRWQYLEDPSSSIRIPIETDVEYKLYWDDGYNTNIYRVAFVKTDTNPSRNNNYINVYKSDGMPGSEFRADSQSYPTYTFKVTDNSIKYIVIQIAGSNIPWDTGDFSYLWNNISHLHLIRTNYIPSKN